jgi:hypothetical protein
MSGWQPINAFYRSNPNGSLDIRLVPQSSPVPLGPVINHQPIPLVHHKPIHVLPPYSPNCKLGQSGLQFCNSGTPTPCSTASGQLGYYCAPSSPTSNLAAVAAAIPPPRSRAGPRPLPVCQPYQDGQGYCNSGTPTACNIPGYYCSQ